MKILIIPSWYRSGAGHQLGSFFKEQAKAIQTNNVDVIIADATLKDRKNYGLNTNFRLKKFYDEQLLTYSYTLPSFGAYRFPMIGVELYSANLKKIFKRVLKEGEKPDIIHAHSYYPAGIAALRIGRKYNIPVVITEHSSRVLMKEYGTTQKRFLKKCVQESDVFITVSSALKKSVEDICGNKEHIRVIPNIVNSKFTLGERKQNNKFIFLTVGNLVQSKRIDMLIKGFAKVYKGLTNFELRVVGDGPMKKELETLVLDLNLSEQVVFLGKKNREDVKIEMQNCDVFALVSDYETFGVVYIEALACGKPVIATRNGGAEEIVTEENGVLINKGSQDELCEAYRYIYKRYSSYNKSEISQNCINKYGETHVSEEIIKVYRKLLARKKE